jgi:hypothetical protein
MIDMQQMLELLLSNQEKAEANAKAKIEQMLAEISARMDANTKEMNAKMDANQAKATKQEEILTEISTRMNANLKDLREEIKSGQAEMRSTIYAYWSELKETIQHEMKAVIRPIRAELDETSACNRATETEPDPGMMQSIEEHQEIPKEDAAVMLVGEQRKQRRVCNLAMKYRQKMRERIRGYNGSRRKSATCKKVSHHAKVARQKRNLIRKVRIQASHDSQKELAVARREMMHRAKVAQRRGQHRKRYEENVAPKTLKGQMSGMRRWKGPEHNNGMRD